MKPVFILLTGLSGSGKTTLGSKLTSYYTTRGKKIIHLDGDIIRKKYHQSLGFSREDRQKQLMQTGVLGVSYLKKGIPVIASLIAPYHEDRIKIKEYIKNKGFHFILIHIDCPIDICIQRDAKGLYKKALQGRIKNFTGINAPYETPLHPDLVIMTHLLNPELSMLKCITEKIIED
ncbi:adenylyl-sulfate kinase [Aquimarina longa]|uniref:adenylyl-sulfate kinase n=1 Tax=Aquimarina longa TaxID=1080221 RepID=UPI0007838E4C|nr:adenylyl-sulfate kinase [Aquimarina longa]